jgi:hypothetical protein
MKINGADSPAEWGAFVVLRDRQHALLPQLTALAAAYSIKSGPLVGTDSDEHDTVSIDFVTRMYRTLAMR